MTMSTRPSGSWPAGRSGLRAALAFLLWVAPAVAFAQERSVAREAAPSRTPKVLLIGLDGVRVDILAEANTPNIDSLIAAGAFTDEALTGTRTWSGPSWSSMLTGVWADKHLVLGNNFAGNDYATYPDFLTRIEQVRPESYTLAVVDWTPLGTKASNGPLIGPGPDAKIVLDGDANDYVWADSISTAIAVDYLRGARVDAAFVYLGNIDMVGHATSSLAPEYRASIEAADVQVGALVRAVRARPTYADEDWLILMSTDHGRNDDGGHGGDTPVQRTIFFLASGPSVTPGTAIDGVEIVDVAVTALTHLGIEIDPAWNLDGKAVELSRP